MTRGRRKEFARFAAFRDEAARERIPDPNAPSTFEASKLRWEERDAPGHAERLALIARLLELRRLHLVAGLAAQRRGGSYRCDGGLIRIEWPLGDGSPWHMLANLGDAQARSGPAPEGRRSTPRMWQPDGDGLCFEPGGVLVARVGTVARSKAA